MENDLSFLQLRQANLVRAENSFKSCGAWDTPRWIMELIGEVGELANVLKKVERGDFTLEQAIGDIAKEIADVQIYLDLLSAHLAIDLGEATRAKFNEVSARVGSEVTL